MIKSKRPLSLNYNGPFVTIGTKNGVRDMPLEL